MSDYHVPTYEVEAAMDRAITAEAKEAELLSRIRGLESQVRLQEESIKYWVAAYGCAVMRETEAKAELDRVVEIAWDLIVRARSGE